LTYRIISMGVNGTRGLDDHGLVRALRALGDTTRFRIAQEVAAAGELSCGQVAELFDISQPTISHHIKILTEAGVLVVRNEGKHHYTSVNRALLASLADLLPLRLSPAARRATPSGRGGPAGERTSGARERVAAPRKRAAALRDRPAATADRGAPRERATASKPRT
jgi:ArsR family transcriptional regulator, arsenate/arsenite/antimonite-responsive transcriptional repressor